MTRTRPRGRFLATLRRAMARLSGLVFSRLVIRGAGDGEGEYRMLEKMTIEGFSEALASSSPTPGGGSASALAGSLAASLVVMVCDLTIGREKYRAHDEAMAVARQRAIALRRDLLVLVSRDAASYEAVMAARRLPKGTDAETRVRETAIAQATLYATETPLATAEACAAVLEIAVEVAHKGNVNAVSDAGSAAMLAYAGLRGGVMNIRTNLKGIPEPARQGIIRDRVRRLEVDGERRREEALAAVFSRIGPV